LKEGLVLWGQFVACSATIIIAGTLLTKYADMISKKVGLGHIFIGMVFLGWITSLPEAVVTISAMADIEQPDIGVGNIFGSILVNVFMLCLVDLLIFKGLIYAKATPHIILCATLSIIIILVSTAGIHLSHIYGTRCSNWFDPLNIKFSLISVAILITYIISTYALYRAEKTGKVPEIDPSCPENSTNVRLRTVLLKSIVCSVLILVAGILLSRTSDKIAEHYGIEQSFIGISLIGAITSMPELVCTFAAAKMGFANMALANIFGSNIFDVAILAFADIFYRKGSIYASTERASHSYQIVGILTVLMTAIMIAAVHYRYESKQRVNPVTLLCTLLYIAALIISYSLQ